MQSLPHLSKRAWHVALLTILLVSAGCVTVTGESGGRISYSGSDSGVSCQGQVDQGQHRCTLDTRQVLERVRQHQQGSSGP